MVPKRIGDLLDGGSLYWVIKGNVQVRQRLLGIRPFVDDDGIGRCRLVLDPKPSSPRTGSRVGRSRAGATSRPRTRRVDLKAGRTNDLPPALTRRAGRARPPLAHRDIVDQPRLAEPGRGEEAKRLAAVFDNRRQGLALRSST